MTRSLPHRAVVSLPLNGVRLPRPPRRVVVVTAVAILLATTSMLGSTFAHLRVPAPTGDHPVGKAETILVDALRPELATTDPNDVREVRVVAWYPAEAAGDPAPYLSTLDRIRDGLTSSGSIGELEAAALGFVSTGASADAPALAGEHPVIVFLPGNATNVEFYSAIATELASRGYVVIGLDHPYQVGAVLLADGEVATYTGDPPRSEAEEVRRERIGVMTADIGFILDRLAIDAAGIAGLEGRLDLDRIGLMGHSNGGIAAVEACADARVDACMNIDGQTAAGPFGVELPASAPTKPFLYLTKETVLHPMLASVFEEAGRGAYRVVIPAAGHTAFTDGAAFQPRVLPTANAADDVMTVSRGFIAAFFDHALLGEPRTVFSGLDAPTDVQVYVYPLEPAASE